MLGEETWVRILWVLAEAGEPMSFSELRRAVGVEDAGRFTYHLSRVCEHFVREVGSGYDLDRAGARLVTAANVELTGREQVAEAVDPGTEESCPLCGERDCEKPFHVHLSPTGSGER